MKKINDLEGLTALIGDAAIQKCFTEYMLLMIAKAQQTDRLTELLHKLQDAHDQVNDPVSERELKAFYDVATLLLNNQKI